jgi:death-on-curing protein
MAKRSRASLIARRHYKITLADALLAHDLALERGGLPGILNLDVIESALGRPYTGYYPKIWQKAGATAQSIAGNHGFTDGNKRTALYLILLLLDQSGYWLEPFNGEDTQAAIADLLVQIADHQIEIDQIAEWFRLRIVRVTKLPNSDALP